MRIALLSKSDLPERPGPHWFEFVRGDHRGDVWLDSSAYLEESVMAFLEGTISEVVPYDHWSFVRVSAEESRRLAERLRALSVSLRSTADPAGSLAALAAGSDALSAESLLSQIPADGFRAACSEFAALSKDLGDWFAEAATSAGGASILGM